ncbi:hypothetical protein JCM5296_005863 [Sporobolomyces johnsonii]
MRQPHPYKVGNYTPVRTERALERCDWEGHIPPELAGGLYVRNGGEPALAEDSEGDDGPAYHWFDGDGMLTGVYFDVVPSPAGSNVTPLVIPTFVNRYVLTDVFLASQALGVRAPILPSIATLLGSVWTLHIIVASIFRAVFLAFCSFFFTETPLRHLSVANTSILWHDGRPLASCESGPLVHVTLPELDTVGYWSLEGDNGEPGMRQGVSGWMKEWTTGHPKRDPFTQELILFHSTFIPPFLHYSVIPSTSRGSSLASAPDEKAPRTPRILGYPVPISAPRMMHDCASSRTHTILLDMPLSLDPRNLVCGKPVISYDPSQPSRFGVFARHAPDQVCWYKAPPCIIFHTVLAFDEYRPSSRSAVDPARPRPEDVEAVSLVCCRLNSPSLVYAAGNLPLPASQSLPSGSKEACELYYYRFPLHSSRPSPPSLVSPRPSHAFPLAAIPFEFPTVPQDRVVGPSKYAYGCSVKHGNFGAALGGAAKIDCLVKVNIEVLITAGMERHQRTRQEDAEEDHELPVDERTVPEVLAAQTPRTTATPSSPHYTLDDVSIRVFELPPLHYAQESSFVPRVGTAAFPSRGEDDGYLLTYVFDERQLDLETGRPREDARSELWVVNAWDMRSVVAKVKLPQRVPYGLHGHWFPPEEIASQRRPSSLRTRPKKQQQQPSPSKTA